MIRVFGSQSCSKCQTLINGLKLLQMPFEYIDAMADDTQELCDLHDVGTLPHIQVIENNEIVWEKAQHVTLTDIVRVINPRSVKQ